MLRRSGGLARPGEMIAGVMITALGMIYGFAGINVMQLKPEDQLTAQPLAEVPMVLQDR